MSGISGVSGVEDFVRLAKNLKDADPELRKALLRKIREAGKPVAHDMKAGIKATLPNRGGLADRAARASIGIRTRAAGKQAGIRLQANGSKRSLTSRTLRSIDESGTWRHPTYGHAPWAEQSDGASQGWFTEEAEKAAPEIQENALEAMAETARMIVRGV